MAERSGPQGLTTVVVGKGQVSCEGGQGSRPYHAGGDAAGPRTDHHVGDPAAPVLPAVGVGHDGQDGLLQLVRGLEGWKDRGRGVRAQGEENSAHQNPAFPWRGPPSQRSWVMSTTFQESGRWFLSSSTPGSASAVPAQLVKQVLPAGPLRHRPTRPCVWAEGCPSSPVLCLGMLGGPMREHLPVLPFLGCSRPVKGPAGRL